MGKKTKVPQQADPRAVAREEARLNRLDVISPDGDIRFGYRDGGTGNFVPGAAPDGAQAAVRVGDSPLNAALRARLEPAAVRMTNQVLAQRRYMPPPAQIRNTDHFTRDVFDRSRSMLDPVFEQEDRRLFTNLQARGLPIGSAAYDEQLENTRRSRRDTLSRLAVDARLAGGQEQSRQYDLEAHRRATALGELATMFGGSYTPALSGLSVPGASPVSIAGPMAQNANMRMQASMANAQTNAQLGTMGGMAAAALLAPFL